MTKVRKYTEEFKKTVVRNYYESGLPKKTIVEKWNLCGTCQLIQWLKAFPADEELLALRAEAERQMEKEQRESPEALSRRIRELESELAHEKLRARAFEKMIEIAEEEEGISILKKGGAKR